MNEKTHTRCLLICLFDSFCASVLSRKTINKFIVKRRKFNLVYLNLPVLFFNHSHNILCVQLDFVSFSYYFEWFCFIVSISSDLVSHQKCHQLRLEILWKLLPENRSKLCKQKKIVTQNEYNKFSINWHKNKSSKFIIFA